MSEIKLNLLDSHTLLTATVHGSVGDALVAALSAEPETIDELETALKRFQKCDSIPASSLRRQPRGPIDDRPWDAGIMVIDLAALELSRTNRLTRHRRTVEGSIITTANIQQGFHSVTSYQTTGCLRVQSKTIKFAVITGSNSAQRYRHSILVQFSTARLFWSLSSRMFNFLTRQQSVDANNIARQSSTFIVAGL